MREVGENRERTTGAKALGELAGQRAEGRGQGAGLWQPLKDLKPASACSELSFRERQQDRVGCRERNQDEGSVDSGKTWSVLFFAA